MFVIIRGFEHFNTFHIPVKIHISTTSRMCSFFIQTWSLYEIHLKYSHTYNHFRQPGYRTLSKQLNHI